MNQHNKPKRKIKPITESRWKLPAAAAAILVILFAGVAIGMFFRVSSATIEYSPPDNTMVDADACATLASPVQNPISTATLLAMPSVTVPVGGESIDLSAVQLTATALKSILEEPTASPMATMPPPSEPVSSVADGDDAAAYGYESDETVAGLGSAGEALPDTGGGRGGDAAYAAPESEAIVPTSVATFDDRTRDGEEAMPVEEGVVDRAETSEERAGAYTNEQQVIEPLRAGEIDDNADWDVYQEYRNNYFRTNSHNSVNDRDVTDRQIIRVVDEDGLPVLGACVQVYLGTSLVTQHRTFATGMTMFFPELLDRTRYVDEFRVVVSKSTGVHRADVEAVLDREAIGDTLTVELPITQQVTPKLDVVFLIDATGSMADEIRQLQENILAISDQIDELPGDVDVRYGLVSYRDFGDDYVTRVYDFTEDVNAFQESLREVEAGGGGDTPEALNEGLDESLNAVDWRGDNTVKLVFLVTDAPPHIDYDNGLDYSISMFDALARGIKIHPIASSGLNPAGEFILRQIGQVTMGHFIFLTYEGNNTAVAGDDRTDLEVGTPEDEQGVGDYSVSQLDEVVLRLITDELAALQGE